MRSNLLGGNWRNHFYFAFVFLIVPVLFATTLPPLARMVFPSCEYFPNFLDEVKAFSFYLLSFNLFLFQYSIYIYSISASAKMLLVLVDLLC